MEETPEAVLRSRAAPTPARAPRARFAEASCAHGTPAGRRGLARQVRVGGVRRFKRRGPGTRGARAAPPPTWMDNIMI